jgi:hypothetical protein
MPGMGRPSAGTVASAHQNWRESHQAARLDEVPRLIDRRQAVLSREVDDQLPVHQRKPALEIQEPVQLVAGNRCERRFELGEVGRTIGLDGDPEGRRPRSRASRNSSDGGVWNGA